MSDYIKREDAKDIKFKEGINEDSILFVRYVDVKEHLDKVPSADVVEVRHSVWRVASADPDKEYECMKCKKAVGWKYLYCPNCGAKMDGEEE